MNEQMNIEAEREAEQEAQMLCGGWAGCLKY